MDRIVVDVITGQVTVVPLTDEEVAALEAQPPEPVAPYQLYKTDIYSRMTDAELEAFDTAMRAAPLRERLMWADCVTVSSDSEYFLLLVSSMTAAFGDERTATILART